MILRRFHSTILLAPAALKNSGLLAGPLLALLLLWLGPPEGISDPAWRVLALTVLMAAWWVSEAIPIAATALLPVALLPLLGHAPIADAAAPYANPLIFLFLGGFILAEAIQRWGLHKRLAMLVLRASGPRLDRMVAGFMIATAGLSMWVSNTATAALMLPIGLSVLALLEASEGESLPSGMTPALLLGIAFAANIGGMATLIGTPPNALLAAYFNEAYGIQVGFAQWMVIGVPFATLMLALTWWTLTRWIYPLPSQRYPQIGELMERQRAELGRMGSAEQRVAIICTLVAVAWLTRPLLESWIPGSGLTDPGIAVIGALILFLTPSGDRGQTKLIDWHGARNIPWGVLLLVGGGLSLGTAIESSGLAAVAAAGLSVLANWPLWTVVLSVGVVAMLLSHVTSNTATAATLLPLVTTLALTLGANPLLLAVPVALAASCAFMLPVATPPNAIVFSSERLSVIQMVRAGAPLSLAGSLLAGLLALLLAVRILG